MVNGGPQVSGNTAITAVRLSVCIYIPTCNVTRNCRTAECIYYIFFSYHQQIDWEQFFCEAMISYALWVWVYPQYI